MTKAEFYEKYGHVIVVFKSYYKYTFTFEGLLYDIPITVDVGGNHDDIYSFDVAPDRPYTINELYPYAGKYLNDEFYDY